MFLIPVVIFKLKRIKIKKTAICPQIWLFASKDTIQ